MLICLPPSLGYVTLGGNFLYLEDTFRTPSMLQAPVSKGQPDVSAEYCTWLFPSGQENNILRNILNHMLQAPAVWESVCNHIFWRKKSELFGNLCVLFIAITCVCAGMKLIPIHCLLGFLLFCFIVTTFIVTTVPFVYLMSLHGLSIWCRCMVLRKYWIQLLRCCVSFGPGKLKRVFS